ncbi:YfhO family protein [Allobaculum sp. Allo2]|uniref:YfhO family protein n=1 Tax=Allobaculum sp. Allo2 TaxID=2853432 RepID=UPI0021127490|nr:YfhO family protein [Allobaculum sp. Allo2]UNT94171.1 YfhO family protein [Allobaculum sp. Allo2]
MITLLVASLAWLVTWIVIGLFPLGEASLCTNDGYAQYMPFLSEFWSIFREGGSVFYSWNGGLGGNFFLTIAYYLMSPLPSWRFCSTVRRFRSQPI